MNSTYVIPSVFARRRKKRIAKCQYHRYNRLQWFTNLIYSIVYIQHFKISASITQFEQAVLSIQANYYYSTYKYPVDNNTSRDRFLAWTIQVNYKLYLINLFCVRSSTLLEWTNGNHCHSNCCMKRLSTFLSLSPLLFPFFHFSLFLSLSLFLRSECLSKHKTSSKNIYIFLGCLRKPNWTHPMLLHQKWVFHVNLAKARYISSSDYLKK